MMMMMIQRQNELCHSRAIDPTRNVNIEPLLVAKAPNSFCVYQKIKRRESGSLREPIFYRKGKPWRKMKLRLL